MPRLSRIIPSMYQRRLLLLGGMCLVGLAVPLVQMTRLSVVKGPVLLADAERRLIDERWLETTRGRILDRRGRVLALDRPSFDIAVDYPVITGQWAYTQAARRARRAHRAEWSQLSAEQRDALIREYQPEFESQLDAMWTRFCTIAGMSRADLDERRLEVRRQVQELALAVTERKRAERQRQLEERMGKGEEQTVDVATADVRRPIREQSAPHVLLKGVPESVGFEFARLLAEERTRSARVGEGGASGEGGVSLLPGVHVVDSGRREYPFDTAEVAVDLSSFPGPLRQDETATVRVEGVATLVLGWMRSKLQDEDLQRRPRTGVDGTVDRGHYRPGDAVGQGGVEQGAEDRLRGLRGTLLHHLDSDRVDRIEPVPGGDVQLVLDAALQARIQALFDPSLGLTIVQPWHKRKDAPPTPPDGPRELPPATPLNGSVVVLDVATGDILALVSMPSFSHRDLEIDPSRVFDDAERTPYLNRAIDKAYPPGSIVKPLVLCAAISAGHFGVSERVRCTGHFFPGKPMLYRCWIYKQSRNTRTHDEQFGGGLDGAEAIQVSCNIFFFELGQRLGPAGITDWYTRFGVGPSAERWELFGPAPRVARFPNESEESWLRRQQAVDRQRAPLHEHAGSLQRDPDKPGGPRPALTTSEAILMGIGQGPITWTPLHAADAYATIARGGIRRTPRLRSDAPQRQADAGLDRAAVRLALEGLRRSANEDGGTTHHVNFDMPDGSVRKERTFNVPGVSIWAKSGTADAPAFDLHVDEEGKAIRFDADHAWCVFLAGEADVPKYAIAVVIERGGSGGRVAGPVANQVVHALVAEGYLPRVAASPADSDRALAVGGR